MTEQEWIAFDDPRPMLRFVQETTDERRLRLFVCACCRLIWPHLRDARSRQAVEVGERYADGHLDAAVREEALRAADRPVYTLQRHNRRHRNYLLTRGLRGAIAARITCWPGNGFSACASVCVDQVLEILDPPDASILGGLARDIFGNPFHPTSSLDRAWLGPTVTGLASAAYEWRTLPSGELVLENDRLAVLSDALEETGCTDTALLDHLRSPGPHVRGCWAVDRCLARGE